MKDKSLKKEKCTHDKTISLLLQCVFLRIKWFLLSNASLRLSLFYFSLFDECSRCFSQFQPPQYAHFILFYFSHRKYLISKYVISLIYIYYWTTVSLFSPFSPFSNCTNKINNTNTHSKLFFPKLFILFYFSLAVNNKSFHSFRCFHFRLSVIEVSIICESITVLWRNERKILQITDMCSDFSILIVRWD